MTNHELAELKELRTQHEAMLRGKPWDTQVHNDYVKLLIYHAPDLLKYAEASPDA